MLYLSLIILTVIIKVPKFGTERTGLELTLKIRTLDMLI
jgi:hypothetical protein